MNTETKDAPQTNPLTDEQKKEGNAVIAQYMGYQYINGNWESPDRRIKPAFKYYDSLDELMPVIRKMERQIPIVYQLTINIIPQARICYVPKTKPHKYFVSEQAYPMTEAQCTWQVVVEFLTWFKQQNS